jgi:hypothetical protein
MDNKLFLEWLNALTYWEYPKTDSKDVKPHITNNKRAIKAKLDRLKAKEALLADVDLDEDEEVIEEKIFPTDINPTRSPLVLAIRHEDKPCEDCGIVGKDRRIECKIYSTGGDHWRKRCTQCNNVYNPDTGKFDLDSRTAHFYFKDKITRRNK